MAAVFHRVLRADPAAPSVLRRAFRGWLERLGWPAAESDDLVIALNEAATDLVGRSGSSAFGNQPGYLGTRATHTRHPSGQRRLIIEVFGWGSWRPPGEPGIRGRGLHLIRACTAALDVEPTPGGTRITLVSRPVPVSTRARPASGDRGRLASPPLPRRSPERGRSPELDRRAPRPVSLAPLN
jgi:anti-sigma regulatory factor (Ser/Thr protein kinase)